MIFGEFENLKENDLPLFEDDQIIFSYLIFSKNLLKPDTLAAFSTDHSPITFSLCYLKEFPRGKGL